jgi:transposase
MAPNLAKSQTELIGDMIFSGVSFTNSEIAKAAGCSIRCIQAIRSNFQHFGSLKAPRNGGGRRASVTPLMLDALCEHLLEKPGLYRSEMVIFLWDEFDVLVSTYSVGRALNSRNWTKKTIRRVANGRNPDLRDLYLHNLEEFRSYHLIYVDESGYNQRVGFRRTGWSPTSTTRIQVTRFQRENRYQILPAYAQDGIIYARVFQGSIDSTVFEDYIKELLPLYGRWPEPKSVLIIDNASFHYIERIEQMCYEAGVKLVYLPPYSPDLNPIEEFFAKLKAFIRQN